MMKYAVEVAGAAVGGWAGSYVATHFLIKSESNPTGFVELKDGFGLDDIVLWAAFGIGALAGVKIAGKIKGG